MNEGSVKFAVEKGFFVCENEIFALPLPAIEKLTYLALTRYAGTNNRAWPAYETLANDVSCGRKRVIEAVAHLVECKLVAKQGRGNRTNVYLIYPPEYFCDNKSTVAQGVERTPQADGGSVSPEHPESGPGTSPECREDTLRVSTGHPKNNNKNTSEKYTLNDPSKKEERCLNESTIKKECERKSEGEINSESEEAVRGLFKAKGFRVSDKVIDALLGGYSFDAVKAAIQGTDFSAARNPLAVIKWMLSTGVYMIPIPKKSPAAAETRVPDPVEDALVRQMIREAKAGLQRKTGSLASSVMPAD